VVVGLFGLLAVLSAVAPTLPVLLGTRALGALAAAVYVPVAGAAGVALLPEDRRARALGAVLTGASLGAALGVLLATTLSWRAAFALVGVLGMAGVLALLRGGRGPTVEVVPDPTTPPAPTAVRERLRRAGHGCVLGLLAVTVLALTASSSTYMYLSAAVAGPELALVVAAFGVAGLAGTWWGGRGGRPIRGRRVAAAALVMLGAGAVRPAHLRTAPRPRGRGAGRGTGHRRRRPGVGPCHRLLRGGAAPHDPARSKGHVMSTSTARVAELGTILGIWAHPDDEAYLSAGLMAIARLNGQRVACVTATRGELGAPDPVAWPPDRLAVERTQELARSLGILGVTEHEWLPYRDGKCASVPPADAVSRLCELIDRVRPDTVLTFGPDGLTGHDDHRTVSAWATAAFNRAAPPEARLLHATLAQRRVRVERAGGRAGHLPAGGSRCSPRPTGSPSTCGWTRTSPSSSSVRWPRRRPRPPR
jgi:LmbE family N-acetylglucosaminyl deacetylase